MRILLIAPSQKGSSVPRLDTLPEIRAIVSRHQTTLLLDNVTLQSIYSSVENEQYDIVHFAGHSFQNGVWINDSEVLDLEDCAQIARTADAKLVFFNGCDSASIASYLIRHGVPYSIYTTAQLEDRTAWQMPNTFYSILSRTDDFVAAYVKADGGSGLYGLVVSPDELVVNAGIKKELDKFIILTGGLRKQILWLYAFQIAQLIGFFYLLYRGH